MEDGVRTTQEQLPAHPFGEALNALKLIEKCSNGLKNTVAAFPFLQIEHTMLQINPCDSTFFPAFAHTFNH